MGRRRRTDTLDAQIQTVLASGGEIKPPKEVPLKEGALAFWHKIIQARARDSWTEVDLVQASNLANIFQDIVEIRATLEGEGLVLVNERGTKVSNPLVGMLGEMIRLATQTMTKLHVHAEATQGRARDTGQRTKAQKELLDSMPDDDLLAKPSVQ